MAATSMRRVARWSLFVPVVCGLPGALAAQTGDPLFGSWRSSPLTVGSRAAGMGGAYVAVADDARAAFVNPAGLAQIPLTEITASSGRPWLAVANGRRRVRLAAYYTRAEQDPLPARDGAPRLSLQPSTWEAGVAAGFQPFRRLRLGGALAYRRLLIEEMDRSPQAGSLPPDPLVGRDAGRVRVTAGALVELVRGSVSGSSPLKLGMSVQPGVSWSIPRPGSPDVEIRRPGAGLLGLAWRATNSWSLAAQADFIRYQEVADALRRNVGDAAGGDYRLPNAVEPRVGAEFATPLRCGCGTVKLRAGLHYQSPGTLLYGGSDPVLRDAFAERPWRTVVTLGASLFAEYLGNALRLDVDSRNLLEGPGLSVGLVWRF